MSRRIEFEGYGFECRCSSGPLGAKSTGERQVHQKVPKLRRVQNVRVVERNERSHTQIPNS